jgi:hypothetical protein
MHATVPSVNDDTIENNPPHVISAEISDHVIRAIFSMLVLNYTTHMNPIGLHLLGHRE